MQEQYIRTANMMHSSTPLHNASLKKTNSELVDALAHTLAHPDDKMTPISDERTEYEITMKLFFPPQVDESVDRVASVQSAVAQVSEALKIDSMDLLILSFPGIILDAEDAGTFSDKELHGITSVYEAVAARLVKTGKVGALGVAEFSATRLQQFCDAVSLLPKVNQINLKDCCVTPRDLILFAKKQNIKLFTHGDASDILPTETLRSLYAKSQSAISSAVPLWVCKYTAVASSRGVVENKGYIVAVTAN